MMLTLIQERCGGPLALALLASMSGCTVQPAEPGGTAGEDVAVAGPGAIGALTVAETTVHFIPLVSHNAPHGSAGVAIHRDQGGSIPLGVAVLTDDGAGLSIQVDLSGLIPYPGEYSDHYTLRLRGHAETGTAPVDCTGRVHVGTVFSERASDTNGEFHGSFQVAGRSLAEVGALLFLWDEMPLACGPVTGG